MTHDDGESSSARDEARSEEAGPESLSQVADALEDHAREEGGKTTVGKILAVFSGRAHGPLLLVPGLVSVSPVGAIPGMSIAMGSVIAVVSLQMLFVSGRPWLPSAAKQISIPTRRLETSVERARPWARWCDRYLHVRIQALVGREARAVVAILCLLLGLSMFPLAFVPFAVAPVGLVVAVFGSALAFRDGLLVAVGFGLCLLLAAGVACWWFG